MLIGESSLANAKKAKDMNRGNEFGVDLTILIVNLLWTFYSFFNSDSTMRIFSIANLGAQIIIRCSIHLEFYSWLRHNDENKFLKIFGFFMTSIYFVSLFLYLLIFFLGLNYSATDISTFLNDNIGKFLLVAVIVLGITECLDKVLCTFSDVIIEKRSRK